MSKLYRIRPFYQRSRARGYTLVELIIVVAILGIAGALVVPRMVGRERLKLQAAVRRVIADLSFAQSDALAHQQFRRVVFIDDGGGSGWGTSYAVVRVTSATFTDDYDPDTADYLSDPLSSNGGDYLIDFSTDSNFENVETFAFIDGGNPYVTYDELGGTVRTPTAPGISGFVLVQSGSMRYLVSIAPFTGKLTVQKLS